ncbi:MAG: hypothetical protein COA66_05270 [Arcobacter sp.]|nr:MAG: hypothetical protein COA66_05270 [Arcobacter sp.]
MKKLYEFDINYEYKKKFFLPIRNKNHIIEILMNSVKYMLLSPSVDDDKIEGKLILYVDKMSRLFFIEDDKIYSINFPFSVYEKEDTFKFSFLSIDEISYKLTSDVIELVNCKQDNNNCTLSFFEPIYEYEEDENEYIWSFLHQLLTLEDGYLRYDHDPKNFKKYQERNEEDKHPLHHLDIFYSSNNSFKLGLRCAIDGDTLISFLDSSKDCKYID